MNTIGELLEAKAVIVMTTERRAKAARLRSEVCADLKRMLESPDGFCLDVEILGPLPSLAIHRNIYLNPIKFTDKASAVLRQIKERTQR
jgi:hypothetical protein